MKNDQTSTFEYCPEEGEEHFFVMVPRDLLRDASISVECRWFISYLLSHKSSFKISIPFIIKTQAISKNRIYPIIKEAIEAGYLRRESYLEDGKKRFKYFVSKYGKFKKCLLCPQNQDTEKQDPENEDRKLKQSSSSEEEKKKQYKVGSASPPVSAEASTLFDFFLTKIKERNPEFKEPNKKKWLEDFDALLRIDKRDFEATKQLILWASTHKWWKTACLSPHKLRKSYDEMKMQMLAGQDDELIRKNRNYALSLKDQYPKEFTSLSFDDKYAMNRSIGKEVSFSMNHEAFKRAFLAIFGGEIDD